MQINNGNVLQVNSTGNASFSSFHCLFPAFVNFINISFYFFSFTLQTYSRCRALSALLNKSVEI